VDDDAAEIVGVLLDAVVERLDFLLVKESHYVLLQRPRSLARDDFDYWGLLRNRFVEDRAK
jgi:hypothetical protein